MLSARGKGIYHMTLKVHFNYLVLTQWIFWDKLNESSLGFYENGAIV